MIMFGSLKKKLKELIKKTKDDYEEPMSKDDASHRQPVQEMTLDEKIESISKVEEMEPEIIAEKEEFEKEEIFEEEKEFEEEVKPGDISPEDIEEKIEEEIREEIGEIEKEDIEPEIITEEEEAMEPEIELEKESEKEIIEDELEPEIITEREEELEPEITEEIEPEITEEIEPEIIEEREEELEPEIITEKEISIEIEREKEAEPKIGEQKLKKGFFSRLIKKVKEKTLGEEEISKILKELQMALVENDVAYEVSEKICEDVKKVLVGKSVTRQKIEYLVKDALRYAMMDVMKQEKINLDEEIRKKKDEPYTIIFLGFNGTGKTTSLAKIANKYKEYTPVLAAADTFRAASIEQLEVHGRNLGLEVVKHNYGADSAAVIFDAKNHAKAIGSKLVLADTAGRSHSNVNLMDELKKICRVNKPDLKILVLDALTGNDIYDQSKLFDSAVGVDAIILTKVDVYEKGGAALSAAYTIKKPILFIATGQEYSDLEDFTPERIIENLLAD